MISATEARRRKEEAREKEIGGLAARWVQRCEAAVLRESKRGRSACIVSRPFCWSLFRDKDYLNHLQFETLVQLDEQFAGYETKACTHWRRANGGSWCVRDNSRILVSWEADVPVKATEASESA